MSKLTGVHNTSYVLFYVHVDRFLGSMCVYKVVFIFCRRYAGIIFKDLIFGLIPTSIDLFVSALN